MKRLALLAVLGLGMLGSACAGPAYVVRTPPPPPPPYAFYGRAPRPGFVWTDGFWAWRGRWVWVPGSWVRPPRPHAVWVPGYWAPRHRGYVWFGGHWR